MNLAATSNSTTFTYRDIRNIDKTQLIDECYELSWSALFDCDTLDGKVEILEHTLSYLYDKYVPLKVCRVRYQRCPWITHEIHNAMAERELLLKRYRRTRDVRVLNSYKMVRNRVTSMIRCSKRAYFGSKLNLQLPAGKLWKNIRNLGIYGHDPPSVDIDPTILNDFFSNATSGAAQCTDTRNVSSTFTEGFAFRCVDYLEVLFTLNSIKPTGPGPDSISPTFIKIVAPHIIGPLAHVYNHCLTISQFPTIWKKAIVIPVPKKSSPSLPSDFRPISLLNFLAKVLEKIMSNQVVDHVERLKLLSVWQSGFRSKHSCETALLKVTTDIYEALDKDQLTILVLLDFTKAFDSVDHAKLLVKLREGFGFSSSAVKLIRSFLTDRSQAVKVNNTLSGSASLLCGVPQGSVLGPLLFSLFINDLPRVVANSCIHLYADDVQIYLSRPLGLMEDCIHRINGDLQYIYEWSLENGLSLNPAKSSCLAIYRSLIDKTDFPPISLNNSVLEFVDSVKNLGVYLNSMFTCCSHISHILGKVYGGLRQLWISSSCLSTSVRLRLAKTLIIPFFTYGSVVFSKLDSNCQRRLSVAFNDVIRYVYRLPRYAHVSSYLTSLLGTTIETYLTRRGLMLLYRILSDKSPPYLYDKLHFLRSSRGSGLLIPRCFSRYGERSYLVQVIRKWNSLPANVKRAGSSGIFLRNLIDYGDF